MLIYMHVYYILYYDKNETFDYNVFNYVNFTEEKKTEVSYISKYQKGNFICNIFMSLIESFIKKVLYYIRITFLMQQKGKIPPPL